jgi:hypothetical protein
MMWNTITGSSLHAMVLRERLVFAEMFTCHNGV